MCATSVNRSAGEGKMNKRLQCFNCDPLLQRFQDIDVFSTKLVYKNKSLLQNSGKPILSWLQITTILIRIDEGEKIRNKIW